MNDKELYKAIEELSEEKKKTLKDFVDFLKEKQEKRKFGYAKGFFRMKEDFDEPLEDFKPYME